MTARNTRKNKQESITDTDHMVDMMKKEEDPKQLFSLIQEAERRQKSLDEARSAAVRLLRTKLGETRTFTHEGRIYQIRTRGGEPYLVELAGPRKIKSL